MTFKICGKRHGTDVGQLENEERPFQSSSSFGCVSKTAKVAQEALLSASLASSSSTFSSVDVLNQQNNDKQITGQGFFKNIPIETLQKALIDAVKEGHFEIFRDIIVSDRSKDIFDASSNSLGDVFASASKQGHLKIVQAIIEHESFQDIIFDKIGDAFINASKMGHVQIVQAIIKSNRFKDISPNRISGLAKAFVEAAKGGYLEILQEIVKSNRFNEVRAANKSYGLGDAFKCAVENGHLKIVQEMLNSQWFKDVPISGNPKKEQYGLQEAFIYAIQGKYLKIILEMIGNKRFKDIINDEEQTIEKTLKNVAQTNCLEALQEIMRSEEFKNTQIDGWKNFKEVLNLAKRLLEQSNAEHGSNTSAKNSQATASSTSSSVVMTAKESPIQSFVLALFNNNMQTIQQIINSSDYEQIPLEQLTMAFVHAAHIGNLQVLKAILAKEVFTKIPANILNNVFLKAVEKNSSTVILEIIRSDRFKDISAISLEDVFNLAIKNDQQQFPKVVFS